MTVYSLTRDAAPGRTPRPRRKLATALGLKLDVSWLKRLAAPYLQEKTRNTIRAEDRCRPARKDAQRVAPDGWDAECGSEAVVTGYWNATSRRVLHEWKLTETVASGVEVEEVLRSGATDRGCDRRRHPLRREALPTWKDSAEIVAVVEIRVDASQPLEGSWVADHQGNDGAVHLLWCKRCNESLQRASSTVLVAVGERLYPDDRASVGTGNDYDRHS
jgi:hypothetical protein